MHAWQLQEAKAHFSKVVKEAVETGPQNITLRGKPVVVVISQKEYTRLKKPKVSFVEFMRKSPLVEAKLNIRRKQDMTRKIEL